MNAAAMTMHFEREEPGIRGSVVLAVLVHALLFGVLFFGVRWQSRPPETISVELWVPPPPAAPPVERTESKPEPKVELPPPPRPEPKVEPPRPPDIAIKDKPKPEPPKPKVEPPKPKPEAVKPKPEPVKPKAEPLKPKADPAREAEMQKRMREELAREQSALKLEHERELIKDQLARDQAAAGQKALAAYADKIKAKIRGNILLPQDIKGNPEAIFDVVQLPTGEVLPPVKLRKSSGHRGYDEAVERAILKSSPLPKPDKGELFSRELTLRFRPLD